jgi:hypothetical protein
MPPRRKPAKPGTGGIAVPAAPDTGLIGAPANGNGQTTPDGYPVPMTDEIEGELDGVPFGLLMWGQAGIYNGVDDRMVIAAVVDSQIGVVRPPVARAGNGLDVIIEPPWMAVADCGDGTRAVVASRQTHTLTAQPPQSGTRIDHIWCETRPDDGLWLLKLIPETQTINYSGVSLGRVTMRAQDNLASQFTFSRLVPTIGSHASAQIFDWNSNNFGNLTPDYPIAPTSVRPHRLFKVSAFGEGRFGNPTRFLFFRTAISNSPIVSIDSGQFCQANDWFDWEAEALWHIRADGTRVRQKVAATVSRYSNTRDKQAGQTRPAWSVRAVRTNWGEDANFNRAWQNIQIRFRFGNISSNQLMRCMGSTFETYEPYLE